MFTIRTFYSEDAIPKNKAASKNNMLENFIVINSFKGHSCLRIVILI